MITTGTPYHNPIFAIYEAECTEEGCKGKLKMEQALSAGLRLGELIPYSPAEPMYGRCPLCKGHKMKVVKVPQPPPAKPPQGFTRIPTR